MIELNGKITLVGGDGGELGEILTNDTKNNIASDISEITGFPRIKKPFIMHEKTGGEFVYGSKFSDGHAYYSNIGYYTSKSFTNSQGVFSTPITINITASYLSGLKIDFDETNNVFPTSITVVYNGVQTIHSIQNPIITLYFEATEVQNIEIQISNLNKPNSQLVISNLYNRIIYSIDNKNLISFNVNIYDREYNDKPSWGIISNNGSVEFNDANDIMFNFLCSSQDRHGKKVEFEIKNTDLDNTNNVLVMYSTDFSYDIDGKMVQLSFADALIELQDTYISGINYGNSYTGKAMYEYLMGLTVNASNKITMKEFNDLDNETKTYLNSYTGRLITCVIESDSLWNIWDNFCNIYGCHMACDNNGVIYIKRGI